MGVLPRETRALLGLKGSSRQYWALNNVVYISVLLVQFGLGMGVNLFVGISRHHPGTGAANSVPGILHSVFWAVAHGPIALAIHAALGAAVAVHSLHNLFWNVKWGTRGSAWAAGAGAVFVWAAGFNGGAFLNADKDLSSFLMAVFFGAAVLCYVVVVFVLMHSAVTEQPSGAAVASPMEVTTGQVGTVGTGS